MVNMTKDKSNEGVIMKLKQQLRRLLKRYHKTFDCFGNRKKTK